MIKSERLKKLELELADLLQWMKLGLVPKKELQRHEEEIKLLEGRIEEEKERLQFLKESGDMEEYTTPRRSPHKTVYPDTPTMSDMDMQNEETETGLDIETETVEVDTGDDDKSDDSSSDDAEDEADPFSDKNRWKRGGIIDPDANEW